MASPDGQSIIQGLKRREARFPVMRSDFSPGFAMTNTSLHLRLKRPRRLFPPAIYSI